MAIRPINAKTAPEAGSKGSDSIDFYRDYSSLSLQFPIVAPWWEVTDFFNTLSQARTFLSRSCD